jgi:hypothetical protein
MQVKTQLLIEDVLGVLSVIAFLCVALWLTSLDDDTEIDTDFVKHDNTIEVHIKQGMNQVVYRECVLLAERVEC